MTELCRAVYRRPSSSPSGEEGLYCQYIKDHPTDRHSWYAIELQDQADAEARLAEQQKQKAQMADGTVKEVLEQIDAGFWDSYIEAMLSALHDRKRTVRGVRGFPRLERRRG